MANIPISALPSVQPSGYTNDDLLVIVNYDFTSGTTKNTPLTGLTSYILSGVTQTFGNKWLIPTGDTVTVNSNYQYFIYGDLIVQGTLILEVNSQLVVINGDVINSGGTITNNGTISNIEIPLFDTKVTGGTYSAGTITFTNNSGGTFTVTGITSTFTGNTSATCITDLYVDNLYGCSPITIHDSLQSTGSTAIGELSLALGTGTTASGNYSHSEGSITTSSGDYSHSEGSGTTSSGDYSHSEGVLTNSIGLGSHSEGYSTLSGIKFFTASTIESGNITYQSLIDISSEFIVGGSLFLYSPDLSINRFFIIDSVFYLSPFLNIRLVEPINIPYLTYFAPANNFNSPYATNEVGGNYSHSEGVESISFGYGSHSEGYKTLSLGDYSHSEGINTNSSGDYSHSEGSGTTSFGDYSHSEGQFTSTGRYGGFSGTNIVNGVITLSSNYGNLTTKFNGGQSLILKFPTYDDTSYIVSGSSYIGSNTTIYLTNTILNYSGDFKLGIIKIENDYWIGDQLIKGDYSHSEGYLSQSIGKYSHAEGGSFPSEDVEYGTMSFGSYSHSEGIGSVSVGEGSHSEGYISFSYGKYSHSEGYSTTAIGTGSHSEGLETIANGDYQHTTGKYNTISTTEGAFIVGNGTNSSNRSNLLFAGNNEVNISGKTITTNFQMTSGATTTGYVLTDSDGSGNAQWQQLSSLSGSSVISTTEVSTSTYTATTSYSYYGVTFNGNVDIELPDPSSITGYTLRIKDERGTSSTYRIRLTSSSGLIDGNNYVDMQINYMSLTLVARNNNWWII